MKLSELFALADTLAVRGVVRAEQLRAVGADPDTIALAVAGHWQAAVRGTYVLHRNPLTDVELAHVGRAHAGPGSLVSGTVAARAYGMRWIPDDVPGAVMLVPHDTRRQDSSGTMTVRRCRHFDDLASRSWQGLLIASPARVVVDTCRQVVAHRKATWAGVRTARRDAYDARCLQDVRGIVLGAVADGLCTPDEIGAVLATGNRRDSALVKRACLDAERGAASPPEAEQVDGLLEHNVPFLCNAELWDGDRLVAVVDALLLATGVGSEMDSEERHGNEVSLDATLVRHGRVDASGVRLLHVTPKRYRASPEAHHQDLFAEVRRRQAQGLGHPPGLRIVPRGPVLCGTGSVCPYPVPAWALEAARTGTLPPELLRASPSDGEAA